MTYLSVPTKLSLRAACRVRMHQVQQYPFVICESRSFILRSTVRNDYCCVVVLVFVYSSPGGRICPTARYTAAAAGIGILQTLL